MCWQTWLKPVNLRFHRLRIRHYELSTGWIEIMQPNRWLNHRKMPKPSGKNIWRSKRGLIYTESVNIRPLFCHMQSLDFIVLFSDKCSHLGTVLVAQSVQQAQRILQHVLLHVLLISEQEITCTHLTVQHNTINIPYFDKWLLIHIRSSWNKPIHN